MPKWRLQFQTPLILRTTDELLWSFSAFHLAWIAWTRLEGPVPLWACWAARGPAVRWEVPCCHLQSGHHHRDPCLLQLLTDNAPFPPHFLPSLRKLKLFDKASIKYRLTKFYSLQENSSCSAPTWSYRIGKVRRGGGRKHLKILKP